MRRVLVAIALSAHLASASPGLAAEAAPHDGEGVAYAATTPEDTPAPESLPLRLGKAAVFALVVSALLLAAGAWRRGRRKPRAKGR